MKVEINDSDIQYLEKTEKLLGTDYERKGNYIELDSLICMIRDLLWEIDNLEEKVEYTESYYQDNYEPVSPYKMYGISENDFH